MQNELPKIDIPVDCVAGTDITKELLNLYTDSPCRLKAGIFVLLLDGDIEASINLVRYKIQPMSFITILPQSILQIHKANGNLRIYFIGFSSHFLENNNMYKIVAGERRWRAAKKANLKEIPAVIRKYSEEQVAEIALIENLQRENLNPIEEAIGYNLLMDEFNLTQELISQRVGKSRSAIANSLRLLSLEDEIQKMLILGTLTSGHARAILSLDDKELRIALSKRIIEDNLNVRQAEALAKQLQKKKPQKKKSEKTAYDIEIEKIQNTLSSAMGTKVRINHTAKKGKIEIEYYGNEDLERVLGFFNIKGE